VADRNKDKQKNALFCSPGKKTKQNKRINSFIKVGLSGYTMIDHVNKVTEADFQTVAEFSRGRISCVDKKTKNALYDLHLHRDISCLLSYQLWHSLLKILLF